MLATPTSAIHSASSPSAPTYAKGAKVLLSNHVLEPVKDLVPSSMRGPTHLLRGRITAVLQSTGTSVQCKYRVEIGTSAADVVEEAAFADKDTPPPSTIVVDVEEKDIISQLGNGRDFPDLVIS
ncbi:hypothetical protein FRB94_005712 [Tulasnella sp. JGI-2019a]|nr:hypothetical protein FRB93_003727 [Tulasnella sp. JGI-2019a]KAG9000029.1 hypothetical protein FRB94_005712 [Tulasnella sp. JGI-2019a]KAG9030532.1 hypothetical protein FRB95_003861 [Tulasnella sp. JGI-2019a]